VAYDLDAVEQAARVIERELYATLGRFNLPSRPLREPPAPEVGLDEKLNRGERLFAALDALGWVTEHFHEVLKSWELSPERQAEFPTEDVVLDGPPDQPSIDLRLAHGFALVRLARGKLAWVGNTEPDLFGLGEEFDVLLTPAKPAAGTVAGGTATAGDVIAEAGLSARPKAKHGNDGDNGN
jgi:ribosomal protein L16 Arg81 hydroxylase